MATNISEHQRQRKKENFLRQFRDEKSKEIKQLTAVQFMEIWSHYDTDGKMKRKKYFKHNYIIFYLIKVMVILKVMN